MKKKTIQNSLMFLNGFLFILIAASFVIDPYELLHQRFETAQQKQEEWQPVHLSDLQPYSQYSKSLLKPNLFRWSFQQETRIAKKNVIDDYQIIGTSRTPRGMKAIIRNTITGNSRSISIGDEIGDYLVEDIHSQGIRLSKDSESIELKR